MYVNNKILYSSLTLYDHLAPLATKALTAEELQELEADPTADLDYEEEDAPPTSQQKVYHLRSYNFMILTPHSFRSNLLQSYSLLPGLHANQVPLLLQHSILL